MRRSWLDIFDTKGFAMVAIGVIGAVTFNDSLLTSPNWLLILITATCVYWLAFHKTPS
jgi:hypothetical protein